MIRRALSGRGRTRATLIAAAAALAATWVIVPSASAYPDISDYAVVADDGGIDDVPGQKDLTQQGWTYDAERNNVLSFFNFDDVIRKGGNTLDACLLFDSNDDGNVNFALCGTTGSKDTTTPQASTLYSCKDVRVDRCANSTVLIAPDRSAGTTCAELDRSAPKGFDADPDVDTRVYCTVVLDDVGADAAELVNTCAYSSSEPNSDPADCVVNPGKAEPTITGTTWVYPNATIALNGWVSGGLNTAPADTVTFNLYASADCSTAPLYSQTLAAAASVSTTNTSVQLTVDATYYWKVTYVGNNLNYGFQTLCGDLSTYVDL